MANVFAHVLDMDIRSRNRYINYLFVLTAILVVGFTISFGIYEYRREHAFRVDILHSQLQLNNHHYLEGRADSTIRVTVLDTLGEVLYDSEVADVSTLGNHLMREEIQDALQYGDGFAIKRASEANGEKYFYSATYFRNGVYDGNNSKKNDDVKGIIVRSSVPYSAPLTSSLERDYTFFYYTTGILALIGAVLYLRMRLHRSEEDKRRLKRQLTENAAHELKTPAAAIEGYLETILGIINRLEDEGLGDKRLSCVGASQTNNLGGNDGVSDKVVTNFDRILQYLQRCYAQSQRMSRLLQDMSMLTRLDEATIVRPTTQIDAATILRDIADETSAQFLAKGIALDITQLPVSLPLQGDSALIYSLFRNIFDNALAYASGATRFTVSAEVSSSAVSSSSEYTFTFSDNGIGVQPEHLPHLFERFYRVDKGRSRKLGGTGLGLAIVKNIAIQYGGSAIALPTDSGGLTIIITICEV